MCYYKIINPKDGYIIGIASARNSTGISSEMVEISKNEFSSILNLISSAPTPPAGCEMLLNTELQWESRPLPPEEDGELTDAESLEIIIGGGYKK